LTLTLYEKESEILTGIYLAPTATDGNVYYTSGHHKEGGRQTLHAC